MNRRSLRAKAGALMVLISLIPVGIVALLDTAEMRARIFEDEAALLGARADQLATELDAFNEGYRHEAARIATDPETIAFLGSSGGGLDAARIGLQADGDPGFLGVGLLDRAGRVRAATEAGLDGLDLSVRSYVQRASQGVASISDVYVEGSGEPRIAYAVPVRAADRALIGAAVLWIRAEALWAVARQFNKLAGTGSFAVIFDQDGVRIAHTDSREIVFHPAGVLPAEVLARLVAERRFGDRTRALLQDVRSFPAQFERARAAACDRRLFQGFAPANQQVDYGVARRLTTAPWTVFYMVPQTTLSAPIASLTRERLLVAIAVALAALAIGVGCAAVLVRPIRQLARASTALAAGDLGVRVPAGHDELGQLGRAFNAMAGELEQQAHQVRLSHAELERRVEQRTAELVSANAALKAEIAERARAEAAVREREQSLAITLDSIGDAVIVTDAAGRIARMNPVAEALTGWSLGEAAGRPLAEVFRIVNEESRAAVACPVEEVLREGRTVGLANHTVLISRTGVEVAIADSAAPIKDDATIRGVVLVFRDMTGEHDAQRALAASEQRYRGLYERAPDMYATIDTTSELILECNQTMCDQLGYTKAELVGHSARMVYHPDYIPEETSTRAQLRQDGELLDVERTLRRKDGRAIEVSLNVRAVHDAAGQVTSVRAIWRDITRRKQLERDHRLIVRVSETLRVSTEVTAVLDSISTLLGRYLRVPRCIFSEIDTANDEIVIPCDYHDGLPSLAGHLPLSSFGGGSAAEYARGQIVAVADTASDPRTAAAFEGSYLPAAIRAVVTVPLLHDGAWVACLSVAASEIRTWEDREVALIALVAERVWLWIEHLRALARLRERDVALAVQRSEERFRSLVEGIRDYAVFMLDPLGNITSWNAGAERLKGYTAEEIIGRNLEAFATPEDRARDRPRFMLAQARASGRYEEESWRVRKDGSRFWANVVISAVHDRDGELEGFAEVTRDFTERRAQDRALRVKQAALSQSLKERDVLLQEVHHRVKNNLQVISSLINMQTRKLEQGAARDALLECQTRVLAIALIHEKLYQSADYSQVRFSAYARGLAENVFQATGVSPREVVLELAIDDIALGVDRAIPCGLLINELITNALKHGFPHGRHGRIRVELTKLESGELRLTVADDGVGLPAGFDVHRAQSMGLRLVGTLAEQLDARLVIRNDRGASFELVFRGSS